MTAIGEMTASEGFEQPPSEHPDLGESDVHIWRVNLETQGAPTVGLEGLLSPDERQRADRFYFEKDRKHFVVCRGTLRRILGRYLQKEPKEIRFSYNRYGKPLLSGQNKGNRICFNVSHSHQLALVAVCRRRRIGVDVEWIRPDFGGLQIARRFFSPREVARLVQLPTETQPIAFFNCWTRKEAYIKGKGAGLSLPLDGFDVSLVPGEEAALLSTRHDPKEAARWTLRELFPGPGYVGAVAVEGSSFRMRCWDWLQ